VLVRNAQSVLRASERVVRRHRDAGVHLRRRLLRLPQPRRGRVRWLRGLRGWRRTNVW